MTDLNSFDERNGMYFLPLGGCGHFGANFTLYCCDGKWMAVDCGMGFADDRSPGVDLILPNPDFIESRKKDFAGLVITHAHEDHIGGIAYLWDRLRCPVYLSQFAAEMLKPRLEEVNPDVIKALRIYEGSDTLDLGSFSVQAISMAHSIPEASSLAITTKYGTIVHSGDWNLDPNPTIGDGTDKALIDQIVADKTILAYIGDSTNAMVPGRAGSESDVEAGLTKVFAEHDKKIVVTMISSNAERLISVARAAAANGRRVGLAGRSLWKMHHAAEVCGYFDGLPEFLSEDDIATMPREEVVICATGSQGEWRAALAKISRDEHTRLRVEEGDTVIYSSRKIPGNELNIYKVRSSFCRMGVKTVSHHTETIQISGHPCHDEVADIMTWLKPKMVLPVHGEYPMQKAQADIAREVGVPDDMIRIPDNGDIYCLSGEKPEIHGQVRTDLLAVDGNRIISLRHDSLRKRRYMQEDGAVFVTIMLDEEGRLLPPITVSAPGLLDENEEDDMKMLESIETMIEKGAKLMPGHHSIEEAVRIVTRRVFKERLRKRPIAVVHVVEV